MDTSKVVIIVALAVYLLLPCKAAIGGEIACEVDDPYGHCRSRSEKCIDEHRADQSSCRGEQRADAAEANKHWKPDSQPECPCNSEGWSVSSASEAARCRPDVVNVTFHQFNTGWYIVEVYWKYTEPCGSLVGVQVRLDDAGICSNKMVFGVLVSNFPDCCYCVSTNHTVGMEGRQNFTVQYLSHYSATATVVSFPMVHGSGVSYATRSNAFTRPANCYDPSLPADMARCGIPLYDPPTTFRQTHTSVSNDYSEANVTLSWDPPNQYPYPNPTHYYVRIRADSNSTPWPSCSGDTRCFKVTNSSELTLTHLNVSKTYYVRMGAYHRCSGFVDSTSKRGCGDDNAAGFMLMWPSIILPSVPESIQPFHFHRELAYQVKRALYATSRTGPEVRLELPYDKFTFVGGLQAYGHAIRDVRGHTVFGIHRYQDLDPILGRRWHVRGLNKHGDFCYAKLETVFFHLHRRQPIFDFQVDEGEVTVDGGYMLVFRFVRVEAVREQWDTIASIL